MNPCFTYTDNNQSVLWNISILDSMLKKKTVSLFRNKQRILLIVHMIFGDTNSLPK